MKEKIKAIILAELQSTIEYTEGTDVGVDLWDKNKDVFEKWQDNVAEKSANEIMAAFNIPS